jgi:putative PEP-CTERM system TPR-repeat lipoprotein
VEALAKKQPNHPQSANMRGGVLLAKGDVAGARKAFEQALALQPTFLPAATNLAALDLRDKKPDEAMKRYRDVLAKDPKQVEASLLLATIMQRNGAKPAEIDKVLSDAIEADPASVPARLAQIGYLEQTDRKKEALNAAVKAQAALPDDPRLLGTLGRVQLAHGEYGQAAATFGNLGALHPQDPEPWIAQAAAFIGAKEFTRARAAAGRAIEAQPDNLQIRVTLVDIGVREKRYDTAVDDARIIQKKWPKNSGGYIAEALVLADQKKTAEAEALLRSALPKVDDAGVALTLFSLLVSTNRAAEADKFATDWIASKPKDAAMAAAAGDQSLARHDYATAVRWYRAGLKARPDNPILLNNLAWALGQLKDPQALATAEKARALAPNNAAIVDTLGTLQLQKGDAETAVATLTRASRLAPNAPAIRVNLARALIEVGRKDAGKEQLQAALAMRPSEAVKKEAEQLLGTL